MQALSALACSVGCAFSGFASLKIALFIQPQVMKITKKQTPALRLSLKSSFTSSKLTHECGFSSSLLGIECRHSLLSRAASVAVLEPSQALNFAFYSLPITEGDFGLPSVVFLYKRYGSRPILPFVLSRCWGVISFLF